VGIVTKVGVMAKTSTVTVTRYIEHPVTRKRITRSKKYLTHDPDHICQLEDRVMIRHCDPVSARKNFVLEKVLNSARSRSITPPTPDANSGTTKHAVEERLESS